MPVELRKRKVPAPAPEPAAKKAAKVSKAAAKVETAVGPSETAAARSNGSEKPAKVSAPAVGDTVSLDGFGGEIEKNDGTKTTLKALVDESRAGVVLFTYPAASTPGCTTQACLFRDSYEPLTKDGLAIYGLSRDSPKKNTTFQTKQNLPYPLLCDVKGTLIAAIGCKKAGDKTQRGVFVIDKAGKVLIAEPGGPAATVDAVKKLVGDSGPGAKDTIATATAVKEAAATGPATQSVDDKVTETAERVETEKTEAVTVEAAKDVDMETTEAKPED